MTEFKLDLNTLSCKHINLNQEKNKASYYCRSRTPNEFQGVGEDKAPPLKIHRSISESYMYLCKFAQVETISLSLFKFNIHALRLLFSAAFSKASARERSPTKKYLVIFYSFAGARFAERSTDKQSISTTFYPENLATCELSGVTDDFLLLS